MENIIKPKEKVSLDRTRKIFGIIRNKKNFQNLIKASLAFSTGEMTRAFLDYERQADLTRNRAIMQSRCLTRLL